MNTTKYYWTIAPSIESEGYGDIEPQKPRQVKITKDFGDSSYRVSSVYSQESREKYGFPEFDDDSNASSFVQAEELFDTQEEAFAFYRNKMEKYALELEEKAAYIRKKIKA
ncbi:MAG: hypothetical protein FMNOHCHN_02570 [Ignavibacteriaceae bacterium]|nr:hypothetical protein [Ignavibacteriaceae bacterium]